LIFSTKNREKRIAEELPTKLWPYLAGIASNHRLEAIKVGGVEDHAHSLLLWARPSSGQGGTNLESMLFKMDKRYKNRGQGLRVAGRVWRFQRERLADWKT
jgi:hypothetical protein